MVYIGGASINEYGTGEGGKYGDQNGEECYIQPWYLHHKGWVIIRAKDKHMAKMIAQDMIYICRNDNIGYSYWEHCYGLYNEAKKWNFNCSKVDTPCDTNCAKAVWVCALYAGSKVSDFSTADEVEKFRETGEFEIITDDEITSTDKYLELGDILVTKSKGHTVVVVDDGKSMDGYIFGCSTLYCGKYKVLEDAHMRKLPGIEYDSVKVLEKGKIVISDGLYCFRSKDGRTWYHIIDDDAFGFVSSKMIEVVL